jgi:hypothetical protein
MAQVDDSVAALKSVLMLPLRRWLRSNRVYIWSFCALYYGIHLCYVAVSVFALISGNHPFSVPHNRPLAISFGVASVLMYLAAVLLVLKAPTMIVAEQEVPWLIRDLCTDASWSMRGLVWQFSW